MAPLTDFEAVVHLGKRIMALMAQQPMPESTRQSSRNTLPPCVLRRTSADTVRSITGIATGMMGPPARRCDNQTSGSEGR